MAAITAYCSLLLFVAILPSGSIGGYTLEEMVVFFETLDTMTAKIGEETVIVADKETRVVERLGVVSELLSKHAQEAMLKMKICTCCRVLRLTMAMTNFGSKILKQISEIVKKVLKAAVWDIQKHAQVCAAVAQSHKESTKGNFQEKFEPELKELIAGQVEPAEKANAKAVKYADTFGETAYSAYIKGTLKECLNTVSVKSVNKIFDALLDQELDESVKPDVAEPENKELYKTESTKAAKDATMALLQGQIAKVLQDIRDTFHNVYPSVMIFHDAIFNNIEVLNPETNTNLKLPRTASEELEKQSQSAQSMYNNVCIGKNISQDTIYLPLGEVDLQEMKKESIPTKTLLGWQEKMKTKILAEIAILPENWKSTSEA